MGRGGDGGDGGAQDETRSMCDSDDSDDSHGGEDEAARLERQKMFAELKTRSPEEIKTHACQTAAVEVRQLSKTGCFLPQLAGSVLPSFSSRALCDDKPSHATGQQTQPPRVLLALAAA